jgi:hypothetical protein
MAEEMECGQKKTERNKMTEGRNGSKRREIETGPKRGKKMSQENKSVGAKVPQPKRFKKKVLDVGRLKVAFACLLFNHRRCPKS